MGIEKKKKNTLFYQRTSLVKRIYLATEWSLRQALCGSDSQEGTPVPVAGTHPSESKNKRKQLPALQGAVALAGVCGLHRAPCTNH
jgi:hypothetical protein